MADNFYAKYSANEPATVVSSLNGLTGALTLVAGTGITITPGSGTLTIDASGSSGANTALSNLTSPTAINQSLLSGGATLNIGTPDGTNFGALNLFTGFIGGGGPSSDINITTGDSADDAPGYITLKIGSGSFGGGEIRFQPFSGFGNVGQLWRQSNPDGSGQWYDSLAASNQYTVSCIGTNPITIATPETTIFDGVDISASSSLYVFLTAQTDPTENGIWYFAGPSLNRPTVWRNGTIIPPDSKLAVLQGGTYYGNTSWLVNISAANTSVIVGTDDITSKLNGFNPAAIGFSLIPIGSNNWDLGDPSNNWNNVHTSQVNADLTDLTVYSSLGVTVQANTNPLNLITSNQSGPTSNILIASGNSDTDNSGDVSITSGTADISSGTVTISSGDSVSSGSSATFIRTGASATDSGNIELSTGTASGTRGVIAMSATSLNLPTGTVDPASPSAGSIYFNTGTSKLRLFDGTSWVDLN